MLKEVLNTWNILYSAFHGLALAFIPMIKILFSGALLPFTVLGIIGFLLRKKA